MNIIKKIYFTTEFILFYLYKLVQSNIYIAYDILTPRLRSTPDIIKVPLQIESDFGLLLFTNLLSMTPGTLTIDICEGKKELLVHVLYSKNKESVMFEINEIQQKIQQIINQ